MRASKRAFDLVAASVGLVLLSPVLALVAVAIRIEGRGPILFRQVRVGRAGRNFEILKFRSMVADAEARGPQLTVGGDPRITRIGAYLRRSKLDELPQLINVVRGEMSLVGPRPEVPRYTALYSGPQRAVLELTPGITDPASIEFVDESKLLAASADPERTYVEVVMPKKIERNLAYSANATFWTDIWQILKTLRRISP